jgi:hypothetical protein
MDNIKIASIDLFSFSVGVVCIFLSIYMLSKRYYRNSGALGAKTTAKEVIECCGKGKYLNGKTALVTGGNR